jgi:hypothetical protein
MLVLLSSTFVTFHTSRHKCLLVIVINIKTITVTLYSTHLPHKQMLHIFPGCTYVLRISFENTKGTIATVAPLHQFRASAMLLLLTVTLDNNSITFIREVGNTPLNIPVEIVGH